MEEYESYLDNLSQKELKESIKLLLESNDAISKTKLTYALGTYMLKIYEENGFSPVFPLELLPATKEEIKTKWRDKIYKQGFGES